MAKKYVSRARVTRNGKRVEHLKNFKMGEAVYRGEVPTMDGGGTSDITKRRRFSLDYAMPKTDPKLDWSDVDDENWVIDLEGGRQVIYTGVDCLKRGEFTIDGENESVFTVDFWADSEVIK